jgi:hypothetical protein
MPNDVKLLQICTLSWRVFIIVAADIEKEFAL